jgi:large subunit ribosomal protein L4
MKLEIPEFKFSENKIVKNSIDISNDIEIESARSLAFVVRWQLARNRAGTAKTKKMSEISGTTAKPWKQKGTGRARQGSRRSVQFVGGRTCHGPNPRSFDFQMPKKIAEIAISDAIKTKIANNKISTFNSSLEIKTKNADIFLKNHNINNALFIVDNLEAKSIKSLRNIKNVKIIKDSAINALDLLNYDQIIVENNSFTSKFMEAVR